MNTIQITFIVFSMVHVLACLAGYHASQYYYGAGSSHYGRYPHYGFGGLHIPRTVYGLGHYSSYGYSRSKAYGAYGGYGGYGGFSGFGFGGHPFFGWGTFDDFDFFD